MFLNLLFLALLKQTLAQDCSSLEIDAIFPCTINFSLDSTTSTCVLSSCQTNSPGNSVEQSNTTICFVSCCPGFSVPAVLSKDNLMSCYNKFNDSPALVYIIGILIAVALISICAILPCCTHKECPLFRLRSKFYDWLRGRRSRSLSKQSQPSKQKQLYQQKSSLELSKIILPIKSIAELEPNILEIEVMIRENEDEGSSQENVCLLCSKKKATCKLSCNHFYHLECIAASWQNLECCPLCEAKQVFPLNYYCNKCFKNAVPLNTLAKPLSSSVCSSCSTK